MHARIRALVCTLSICLIASLLPWSARAQSGLDFYKGKTLTLLIAASPGGGYDTLGRMVARHLPDHLPVNRTIVVQNMPGAGGIVMMNHFYKEAPKDGSMIGLVQDTVPFDPLLSVPEARFDALKFNWLGTPTSESEVLAVWHTVPVNSIEDVEKRSITVPSDGAQGTPSFNAKLLNATLGTKLKVIVGYPGQAQMSLAVENSEVDSTLIFYSSMMATRPAWVKNHLVKLLLQYGLQKQPALGDVPFAPDLAKTKADKQLMQAGFADLAVGRPFLAPPGVPADRVAALRTALDATFADPKFLADAKAARFVFDQPRTGTELADFIAAAYRTPPAIVKKLRDLYWK